MSRIATFYSYKGGVGRTFALANIAVLLAKRMKNVLVIDWDLEAPGLHRYFTSQLMSKPRPRLGLIHLLTDAADNPNAEWEPVVENIRLKDSRSIALISSGDQSPDYADRVRAFSWPNFFENCGGGTVLERWRAEWKKEFDFVLVDSRTGITDAGGVCTVLLPDILALVFSSNEQSFVGGVRVALGIQEARRRLDVPRPPVAILPLPGRFDSRDEVDEAARWLDRFAKELKPFYDDWLPKQFNPRQMLELTKVPYVAKFSFGEPLAVLTHGVSDPEFPGFYLDNAARLLTSDFRDAGQILAPESAEKQIEFAEFRSRLARVPLDEDAVKQALALVLKDVPTGPRVAELLNEAGVALLRQGHFDSAEDYFRRALAVSESAAESDDSVALSSLNNLAEVLLLTGRSSEAEASYRQVLEMLMKSLGAEHPAVVGALGNLAGVLRQLGRLDEAQHLYQRTIAILERIADSSDPALPVAYVNLARLFMQSGQLSEAESLYRRAIDRQEKSARRGDPGVARSGLAEVLKAQGRLGEAEQHYREILALDPENVIGRSGLGEILRSQARFAEAEQLYRETISLFPRNVVGRNGLAEVLKAQGRLADAEQIYRETGAIFPHDLFARNGLADVLKAQGRLGEAEQHYRETLVRYPENVIGRNGLADVVKAQGRLADAEHIYRETGAIFPHDLVARNGLGEVLKSQRRLAEAEQLYRETAARFPRNVVGRNGLAEVLKAQGRLAEAEQLYRKTIADFPDDVVARSGLGSILKESR